VKAMSLRMGVLPESARAPAAPTPSDDAPRAQT
jgi:hypothetical protein